MVLKIEDVYIEKLIEEIYKEEVELRADLMGVDYESLEAIIRLTMLKMERDGKIVIEQ